MHIPPELELSAAGRLAQDGTPRADSGRRLIAAANAHGIDLSLMWGTVEPADGGRPARVRQVCLVVPGSGKTAMLVLSAPHSGDGAWLGDADAQRAERVACIEQACRALAAFGRDRNQPVLIAQALPDPAEAWAAAAFLAAGFTRIADLAYMRRPHPGAPLPAPPAGWSDGLTIRTVKGVAPGDADRDLLIEALERSYVDTLDCPGLCGLRRTSDVLDSHRATGRWDARHWHLVLQDGAPHGCLLLTHCPDHHAIELVYLGLSKALRGRGLAAHLLSMGLSRMRSLDADHVACAVDTRNLPALRVYERLGFMSSASRVALVRAIHSAEPGV